MKKRKVDEKLTCHRQDLNPRLSNDTFDALPLSYSGGHPLVHFLGCIYVHLNVEVSALSVAIVAGVQHSFLHSLVCHSGAAVAMEC